MDWLYFLWSYPIRDREIERKKQTNKQTNQNFKLSWWKPQIEYIGVMMTNAEFQLGSARIASRGMWQFKGGSRLTLLFPRNFVVNYLVLKCKHQHASVECNRLQIAWKMLYFCAYSCFLIISHFPEFKFAWNNTKHVSCRLIASFHLGLLISIHSFLCCSIVQYGLFRIIKRQQIVQSQFITNSIFIIVISVGKNMLASYLLYLIFCA